MLDRVRATARFAVALRGIMRNPVSAREGAARIAASLARRDEVFLDTLERGIYQNPRSPYLALLCHARIELDDVRGFVREDGVEGALSRLYEAGVYVTADEFKGRAPIQRDGLDLAVTASDFDNPLADSHFEGRTSGSSGQPTHVFIGFDLMTYEADYYACLFDAQGVATYPVAAALHTALKTTLRHAKRGVLPEKWFTPQPFDWSLNGLKDQYILGPTLLLSRLYRRPLPRPELVPRGEALQVARWLAEKTHIGTPALLETNHSAAVRVCVAAREHGLDIAGSVFHLTGEPYTAAKAEVIAAAGARALDRYANVELGAMGLACANPVSFDDAHFVTDKLALIQRPKLLAGTGVSVDAIVLTSLLPCTPKLMLNVENGDYATIEARDCGCPLGAIGLRTHISSIRSYDKLTSEGATIAATHLFHLLEEVLPARFGGAPTDYQLVEEEVDGLPRVSLFIRPNVGPLDEATVVSTFLDEVQAYARIGAAEWRQGETLRVVRRDPYETSSAKILPLHLRHVAASTDAKVR